MQLKYIKESIKQKHACNGSKNLRNNYTINIPASYKNLIANRKFKLAIDESLKDINIDKALSKKIYRLAKKKGINTKGVGIVKLLQLVK